MNVCQGQKEKILLFALNELDWKEKKEVDAHLKRCELCRNEYRQITTLVQTMRVACEVPDLSRGEVRSLINGILEDKGGKERLWHRLALRPFRLVSALAMVGMIVISAGIFGYRTLRTPDEVRLASNGSDEIIIDDRELEVLSNLELLKELEALQKISIVIYSDEEINSRDGTNNSTSQKGKNDYRRTFV